MISILTEDLRFFVGGYTHDGRLAVFWLGLIGCFFSAGALFGLDDNHFQWVHAFAHFSAVRVVVLVVIFISDIKEFPKCGGLLDNFQSLSDEGRYNQAMLS